MDKAYDRTPTLRSRDLRNNPTEAENCLWKAIRNRQLNGVRFNRQVPIGRYICDFVARSKKLVIEVDGGQHSEAADAQRAAFLISQGYTVIRFWNHDVLQNIESVVAEIEQSLPNPSRKREGLE